MWLSFIVLVWGIAMVGRCDAPSMGFHFTFISVLDYAWLCDELFRTHRYDLLVSIAMQDK